MTQRASRSRSVAFVLLLAAIAAHIHQFADCRNNDITNGLALSKNAHWLFDNGLWTLDDDYRILVATTAFDESSPDQKPLAEYDGQQIRLPRDPVLWPDQEHLSWHRSKKFLDHSLVPDGELAVTKPFDPIKHVVVLMLENRSFDQMLGVLQTLYPHMEGIDPNEPAHTNSDNEGRSYRQAATRKTVIDPDPGHKLHNVLRQIEVVVPPEPDRRCCAGLIHNLKSVVAWLRAMLRWWLRRPAVGTYAAPPYEGKFVLDYSLEHSDSTQEERAQVMSFYPLDFLPALHTLARHFTICDHWFSSVPGPTWPNRFFVHAGTSQGLVHMPSDLGGSKYFVNDQDTLFDRLNERAKSWKIYAGDFPQSLLLEHQRLPENASRYFRRAQFFADARGPEADFPEYAFIEPDYFHSPNDDHPPHDTMDAQALIADVYNAIRANKALWDSTLLIITYDEHGGFFDHVRPPVAVPPDEDAEEYTFDRLG